MNKLTGRILLVAAVLGGMGTAASVAYAKKVFAAECAMVHGLGGSWLGPDRDDEEAAKRDAEEHNKRFPGHNATYRERDVP